MSRRLIAAVLALGLATLAGAAQQLPDEQQQRDALAHYRAGQKLMYAESWAAAEREFREAIKLNPLMTIAYYSLGQIDMSTRRYPEAVEAFSGALKAAERLATLAESQRAVADRMRNDELNELRDSLDAVRSGRVKLADAAHTIIRLESRIADLERGRQRDTDPLEPPPEISLSLGSAYFHMGDLQAAEREYRAAIDARPRFGEAHNNLAVVYMLTNRLQEAKKEIAQAEKSGYRVNPQFKKDLDARIKKGKGLAG